MKNQRDYNVQELDEERAIKCESTTSSSSIKNRVIRRDNIKRTPSNRMHLNASIVKDKQPNITKNSTLKLSLKSSADPLRRLSCAEKFLLFTIVSYLSLSSIALSPVNGKAVTTKNNVNEQKHISEDHLLRFARSVDDDHLLRFAKAANDDHMLRFARSADDGHMLRFAKNDDHMLRFARANNDHMLRFARARNDDHMLRFARARNDDHMLRFARARNDDHMLRFARDHMLRFARDNNDEHMLRFAKRSNDHLLRFARAFNAQYYMSPKEGLESEDEFEKPKRSFGDDYHMLRFARSPDEHLLRFARARNDDHMLRFA